jgi:acetyl/propionyl-CoA carboxylase alpha subunit
LEKLIMQPQYVLGGVTYEVSPVCRRDTITVEVDGHLLDARIQWFDGHHAQLTVNGTVHDVYAAHDDDQIFIHMEGRNWQLTALNEFSEGDSGCAHSGSVKAPMPGVVVELCCEVGMPVAEGDTLMLIESMKLQMEIKASAAGVLAVMDVTAGGSFEKGALLARIDPLDSDTSERSGN